MWYTIYSGVEEDLKIKLKNSFTKGLTISLIGGILVLEVERGTS